MIALISFLMYGNKITQQVLSSIPSNLQHSSGDALSICKYLNSLSQRLKLK
jgi:hypothetical protein